MVKKHFNNYDQRIATHPTTGLPAAYTMKLFSGGVWQLTLWSPEGEPGGVSAYSTRDLLKGVGLVSLIEYDQDGAKRWNGVVVESNLSWVPALLNAMNSRNLHELQVGDGAEVMASGRLTGTTTTYSIGIVPGEGLLFGVSTATIPDGLAEGLVKHDLLAVANLDHYQFAQQAIDAAEEVGDIAVRVLGSKGMTELRAEPNVMQIPV